MMRQLCEREHKDEIEEQLDGDGLTLWFVGDRVAHMTHSQKVV
jgi:hypothetical protein